MPTVPAPAKRVLDTARKYIGQHEEPMGSNDGTFVRRCFDFTFVPFRALARGKAYWCVAFVMRVCAEAGYPLPYRTAGAYDLDRWARKAGWWSKTPRPGAIAIWNIGAGHGSIVESYDPKTGVVTTIDGNVGDQVARRKRDITLARGFVYNPALSKKTAAVPAKQLKTPRRVAVTSEAGHKTTVTRWPWKRDPLDGWVAVG